MVSRSALVVVLGVLLHAVYLFSIFDIYFKTPLVHGMPPVPPRIKPPAQRLVLFVADGLRADKFFELDDLGESRAPFLRHVARHRGRWGVSHARPPTESRPGHVSIIAGFYEDPSAVTKGWKQNPVEFDSVFNRSKLTIAFGSPDILPIFIKEVPHARGASYPGEYEDFATDASYLDTWAFDRFQELMTAATEDRQLAAELARPGLVIFLHLLGLDTNGHAHRPHSKEYLNNIKLVDKGVQQVFDLMEEYFKDNSTAYVFTADHGMSNRGSHGDGDPANTETPLVVWGAGTRGPAPAVSPPPLEDHSRLNASGVSPPSWGLGDVERVDVNQADVAPLMSALLGQACPMNNVGSLPVEYVDMTPEDRAEAVFANAKQILAQAVRKSEVKRSTSLKFTPFAPLETWERQVASIERLLKTGQYNAAEREGLKLRRLSLAGLQYFQTYDWLFLMGVVTGGYLGWMLFATLHVLQFYTAAVGVSRTRRPQSRHRLSVPRGVGLVLMGFLSAVLLLERAPVLYHAYVALAVFFWAEIANEWPTVRHLAASLRTSKAAGAARWLLAVGCCVGTCELLVLSFFDRRVYTFLFLFLGALGAVTALRHNSKAWEIPLLVLVSFWALSVFTLLPIEIADNTPLVCGSSLVVSALALLATRAESHPRSATWQPLVAARSDRKRSRRLLGFQLALVLLSAAHVHVTTGARALQQGLPRLLAGCSWGMLVVSVAAPASSAPTLLSRLVSLFVGFAPAFLLLSLGYEALFYSALGAALFSWLLWESHMQNTPSDNTSPPPPPRALELSDLRVAVLFLMFINVAFFGTGNVASIASFEISSVYRFITVFDPVVMGGLLLLKIFVPFVLVTCTFSAIMRLRNLPRLGMYFLVLLLSDVMAIHFFFLVRNTGSWMEIGNSISHFAIMSAQVVFVLLLFALTNVFTRDMCVAAPRLDRSKLT